MKKTITSLLLIIFISTLTYGQTSVTATAVSKPLAVTVLTPAIADTLSLEKSSEMLDEATYWNIIDNSIKNSSNQADQEVVLIADLEKLSPKEIVGFRLRTDKLLFDTYNQELWCAAYIVNNGSTDGGFDYFRSWLISKGKDAYYSAVKSTDAILKIIDASEEEEYEFEAFGYVAVSAFKAVTNQELFDYIDYDKFTTNDENYPILKFTWNVDEPETMQKVCPKLYERFNK